MINLFILLPIVLVIALIVLFNCDAWVWWEK